MRNLMIAVLMVSVSVVVADEISVGTYIADGGYASGYLAGSQGRFSLYVEREESFEYDLDVLRYQFCDDAALVYRHDSPNWNRPGVDLMVGGGKTTGMVRILLGTGDAETWVDYFGPTIASPIKNLGVESHLRWGVEGENRVWIGPAYSNGRLHIYYHHDFLGGPREAGINIKAFEW